MKPFFFKLNPPRTTFPGDMTPVEAKFMQLHADYWRAMVNQDRAIVLGPVMDPAGSYGIGVILAPDQAAARAMVVDDPVIKVGIGFSGGRAPDAQRDGQNLTSDGPVRFSDGASGHWVQRRRAADDRAWFHCAGSNRTR